MFAGGYPPRNAFAPLVEYPDLRRNLYQLSGSPHSVAIDDLDDIVVELDAAGELLAARYEAVLAAGRYAPTLILEIADGATLPTANGKNAALLAAYRNSGRERLIVDLYWPTASFRLRMWRWFQGVKNPNTQERALRGLPFEHLL
jgi:hypothetical protein